MNTKILKTLEFNKITDLLSDQAGSKLAKQRIEQLQPVSNIRMVSDSLTETTEAVSVITYKGSIPVGDAGDIRGILEMAKRGRILSIKELMLVRRSLSITRDVKAFLTGDMPDGLKILPEIAQLLSPVTELEKDISEAILTEDELSDNASPELKRIRREIRNKNDLIKSRMNRYVAGNGKSYLQEAIVTIRNGRYVIPVKKEYVSQVPGLVHDQSSTGATLFIEPQAIVTMNNELKQLEMDEQAEVTRILEMFSSRVAEHYQEIRNNQELLVELDFINAKGKLSFMMGGSEPSLNEEGYISIVSGRHPLIPEDKVVPVSVELGKEYTTLLITGPNTGGKTVTLKTIGLMVLMTLSGLHIPADYTSCIPILDEIMAEIGDEQSIEQSLSTFSSHMKNLIEIFESAGQGTLVLLDELGAGTDPLEGAALGIAELERFKEMGALVAATTHYTELKKYALSTPGVENASMEFNVETLSPTYRLRVGIPGKSNAFEISRKLGLDETIIERACTLLDENQLNFEKAVSRVERDRQAAEEYLESARSTEEQAGRKLKDAEKEINLAKMKAERIIDDARSQAREILKDAENTVDEISAEIREARRKGRNEGHAVNAVAVGRKKLREAEDSMKPDSTVQSIQTGKPLTKEQVAMGLRVKHVRLGENGTIESLPDSRGNVQVRIGSLKTSCRISDLIIIESEASGNKERKKQRADRMAFSNNKAMTIRTELNLIGRNLDDAIYEMNKYLDDAFLAGLKQVRIVHGRGEGILRSGLRAELKKNKHVKSYKSAPYDEGGEGATIVLFK